MVDTIFLPRLSFVNRRITLTDFISEHATDAEISFYHDVYARVLAAAIAAIITEKGSFDTIKGARRDVQTAQNYALIAAEDAVEAFQFDRELRASHIAACRLASGENA